MRKGLRVFDADTHVEPTAEVLDTYVDPGFRPRLAELAQYKQPVRVGAPGGAPGRHWGKSLPRRQCLVSRIARH